MKSLEDQQQPARAVQRARVFLVEDHLVIRHGLAALIDDEADLTVCGQAASVAEAMPLIRKLKPDVAIIDIGLPGINGYEVARRIREGALPWSRRVKLLALTGYGQPDDQAKALSAGFDLHVTKPIAADHLDRVLSKFGARAGCLSR